MPPIARVAGFWLRRFRRTDASACPAGSRHRRPTPRHYCNRYARRAQCGVIHVAHAELHAAPRGVHAEHAHGYDLADRDHRERIAHEVVGQFRDMDQAILLDADVDEGAEVHDVAHRALQDHPLARSSSLSMSLAQDRLGQAVARVEARLLQVLDDVGQRGHADLQFLGQSDRRAPPLGGRASGTRDDLAAAAGAPRSLTPLARRQRR